MGKEQIKIDMTKVSRSPLLQNGIDIKKFDTKKFIEKNAEKITGEATFVLWNKGKPKLDSCGGNDVIAWILKVGDTIHGWYR